MPWFYLWYAKANITKVQQRQKEQYDKRNHKPGMYVMHYYKNFAHVPIGFVTFRVLALPDGIRQAVT